MAHKIIFILLFCFILITICKSQHFHSESSRIRFQAAIQQSAGDTGHLGGYHDTVAGRIVSGLEWLQNELTLDVLLQGNISSECSADFAEYVAGLLFPFKKWAIKMADATGKPESGILDGNYVFEGRYLQCINVNEDVDSPPIDPLYCFATWRAIIPSQNPVYIAGLGICIPASCSDDDALLLLQTVYQVDRSDDEIKMRCERGNDLSEDPEAIISIIILSLFGLLVLVASIYDACQNKNTSETQRMNLPTKSSGETNTSFQHNEPNDIRHTNNGNEITEENSRVENSTKSDLDTPVIESQIELENKNKALSTETQKIHSSEKERGIWEKILLCFSLYQNVPLIVTAKQPANTYRCLNGLRVIAMTCVVFGHVHSLGWLALDNWKVFYDAILEVGFQKVNTMEVYVDTFFILSAFLVTIGFLKQLKRCNGKLKPVDLALHYFNRYWRLTPVYMIMMMVYSNLTHYFIAGPYAKDYIVDLDSCSTEWWKNLLYVNTLFYNGTQFCFGVSWYLCVDMQMFVIAPLFIYIFYRWDKLGIAATVAGFCGGVIANIVLWEEYYTQAPDAPDPVDPGGDIYVMTWTRCPVYFMGMLLGYFFYKTGGKVKIPPAIVVIGWVVALTMFFITAYLPVLDDCYYFTAITQECHWSVAGKVAWCALYRPMWGIWVCWLITACEAGYGGLIHTFLSWNFFVPLGKLTYMCYLIHYMVITIYWFGVPVQPYFTHLNYIYVFLGVMMTTYMCALVMSSSVLAPLNRLAAVFLPNRRGKTVR